MAIEPEYFATDIAESLEAFVIVDERDDIIAICLDREWADGLLALLPVSARLIVTHNIATGSVLTEVTEDKRN